MMLLSKSMSLDFGLNLSFVLCKGAILNAFNRFMGLRKIIYHFFRFSRALFHSYNKYIIQDYILNKQEGEKK